MALIVIGAGAAGVAWWAGSREASLDAQIRWVNLGMAGFITAAVGEITWVRQARLALRTRRRTLLPDVATVDAVVAEPVAATVIAGPGLALFHRPACPLALGRDWAAVDRTAAVEDGRSACGVCRA
jgi:hypothetical protein